MTEVNNGKTVNELEEAAQAFHEAIRPGATAGDAYAAWREVARSGGLDDYERHHCGYLVGIGFPPSWTGGSMVVAAASQRPRALPRYGVPSALVVHQHGQRGLLCIQHGTPDRVGLRDLDAAYTRTTPGEMIRGRLQ